MLNFDESLSSLIMISTEKHDMMPLAFLIFPLKLKLNSSIKLQMREGDETFQIIFYVQKLHLSGGEKLDLLKSVWKVQAHTFHTHTHTHTLLLL